MMKGGSDILTSFTIFTKIIRESTGIYMLQRVILQLRLHFEGV